jgi:hypothetical protein
MRSKGHTRDSRRDDSVTYNRPTAKEWPAVAQREAKCRAGVVPGSMECYPPTVLGCPFLQPHHPPAALHTSRLLPSTLTPFHSATMATYSGASFPFSAVSQENVSHASKEQQGVPQKRAGQAFGQVRPSQVLTCLERPPAGVARADGPL